jgi:Uncharacterized protein conserved in bacteria
MSEYVLLYRSTSETHDAAMGTPERARESMAKWRKWIDDMTAKGCLKSVGLPLQRAGRVVRGTDKAVVDGPYAETKEVVGGFSIIEARDFEHAAQIASGCPILGGGGSVEVRPVMAFPG